MLGLQPSHLTIQNLCGGLLHANKVPTGKVLDDSQAWGCGDACRCSYSLVGGLTEQHILTLCRNGLERLVLGTLSDERGTRSVGGWRTGSF